MGHERLPSEGPALLLANHFNALVDPLVLLAVSERPLRVVAKHTLWKVPVLGRALEATRAIPVHRTRDDPEARRRNEEFFRTCVEALAGGEALAIFPEGRSHDEPAPVPLRTGAARMALAAVARGSAPSVLPVGLNYDEKGTFRSGLTVLVGEPLQERAES
ncbi:MAG: 1-acyl-sn-glycerol-3-phosphate acyltransferase, partial [Gemmatimonadota bacterium]